APHAPAPGLPAPMPGPRPTPARRQNTAVARPITPPPTTSTSGRRSRSSGIPGSRAARSPGSPVLAPTVPRTGRQAARRIGAAGGRGLTVIDRCVAAELGQLVAGLDLAGGAGV